MNPRAPRAASRGVTLVELIAVITIVGIIASVGASIMTRPVASAMASGDAIQLADQSTQATRRFGEDVARALSNSIRIGTGAGGARYLELLPVEAVGRYRMRAAATGNAGDPLDLEDPADDRFDVLGPLPAVPSGAQLVIHNLGNADADVYAGNNRRAGVVLAGGSLSFAPAGAFPVSSPSGRFSLVTGPVSWVCAPAADGSGTLTRVDGYAIAASQPLDVAASPLASANAVVIARGVVECGFGFDSAQQNLGLVGVRVGLALGDARVRLAHQFVVDNTP